MSYRPGHIDGDQSAKTMDAGAKAGLGHTDLGDGIHENAKLGAEPAGEKTTGHGVSVFDAQGSIGKQFHGRLSCLS